MKPNSSSTAFRKRKAVRQTDRKPLSLRLRDIRDKVQAGATAQGLESIEEVLVKTKLPKEMQGKVLALAADSEYKRGAFEEAAEIHRTAASLCADDTLLWLRPRIGQVRALIKAGRIEESWETARQTLAEARQKWEDFHQVGQQAKAELRRGRRVIVSPRPERLSVVAAELGRLFLREGEVDAAREFLNEAVTACPKGATRARESLAEISMREGDPHTALEWAMQALMMGRLQAKTLHTLRLLVQIKRQIGEPGVGQEVLALVRKAQPSVRARASLLLVQELRATGAAPQWKTLAQSWLAHDGARFPSVASEIKKILLRECKQNAADPHTSLAAAADVMRQPGLSPDEWLSAAKEFVRSSWFAGADPKLERVFLQAKKAYGEEFAFTVAHSISLSTLMARRQDVGIPWLEGKLALMTPGSETWGKSTWALARVESELENHARAAGFYNQFASHESLPLNLRAQARLRWVRLLVTLGDTQALAAGLNEIKALLPAVDDWSILLDIARQLCLVAGEEANAASYAFFDKAEQLALNAVSSAQHPSEAIAILLKLARRTTYDFNLPDHTIQLWTGLSEERHLWLWSESADYWEWVSLILLAYLKSGNMAEAEAMLSRLVNDVSTPKIGRLMLSVTYGDWAMKSENESFEKTGLSVMSQAVALDDSHAWSRKAHYWLALAFWKRGNRHQARIHALKVRLAPWSETGMLDEWKMAARAEWILAGGDENKLDPKMVAKYGDLIKDAKIQ